MNFGSVTKAIHERAHFILGEIDPKLDIEKCTEVSKCLPRFDGVDKGRYWVWVAVTGCYPNKSEFNVFDSKAKTTNFESAVLFLVNYRKANPIWMQLMSDVQFLNPHVKHLSDVTHTYSAPYVTGIQRVVREIVNASSKKEMLTYRILGNLGLLEMCDLEKNVIRESTAKNNEHGNKSMGEKIVFWMENSLPFLQRYVLTQALYVLALPSARHLKRRIQRNNLKNHLSKNQNKYVNNIFIHNKTISILEFPELNEQIQFYELLLEENIVNVQIISYDFIPIFHSWSVHPGNRGQFNNYVRLILLANKVVAISELVRDQVLLITKAFHLERKIWQSRIREVTYLSLPSGLTKIEGTAKVTKDPKLFVMLGSIEPRKNHLQFIDALEILFHRGVYVRARLLGTAGWNNEHILARIAQVQNMGVDI